MKRNHDQAGPSKTRGNKKVFLQSKDEILQNLAQISDQEIYDESDVLAIQESQMSINQIDLNYNRESSPDIISATSSEDEEQDITNNNEQEEITSPQDFYNTGSDSEISIVSSNKVEPSTTKSKKKHNRGRLEDPIWEQFNKVLDGKDKKKVVHALCKKCEQKISPRPTRLRLHKESCKNVEVNSTITLGKNRESRGFVPDSTCNVVTVSNSLSSPSTTSKLSNQKMKQQDIRKHLDTIKPKQKQELDKKVGRLIFGGNLSFKFVENTEFIEYTKALKPSYQLPKRRVIGGTILDDVHTDIMKIIGHELKGKNVVIMQDGWSTKQNAPVVSHCLSTGEKIYFFNSIETEANKKDAGYCYDLLEDAMKEVHKKFECKIIGFISDNCNTMKSLRELTAERNPGLFTYGCNTHILNNLGVALSPGSLLDDIINVNAFFRNHHYESSRLLQLKGTRPILPCVTRWTSQCESIKSYLKNQTKFLEISRDPKSILKPLPQQQRAKKSVPETSAPKKKTAAEKAAEIVGVINNSDLYDNAKTLLEVLQPVAVALDKLQANDATVADAVKEWIQIESLPALQHNQIFTKFKNDWRELYMNPINVAAYCLHPKYRGKGLSSVDSNRAHDFLSNTHPMLSAAAVNLSIMSDVYFPPHMLKEETINILSAGNWWKYIATTEAFTKVVTDYASNLMILPASTSGIERCFSTMSDILTKKRNRLGIQKASKLCVIYRTLSSRKAALSSDDDDDDM